ncbi:branched-chain amino acid ABC transporter permease [Pigmentiphaga sp. NML080357]|uniref:branched-chain amino acid ABC transporter permease n=1 Tax=Pigmentiphaga sp. NML080357 TaxID=2008675 RepID=UPI001E504415|nr:branched-chain amino acid ABC transporter permease [Pigmentiphaga sp. NML080357]
MHIRRPLADRVDRLLVPLLVIAVVITAMGLHGYWAFKVSTLLVFAIAVRSMQLLVGASGQVSLGHGAFFAVGAYTAGVLSTHGWAPGVATVPVAALVTGLAGFLFGLPAVRLAGPYLALATFALALALPQLLKHSAFEGWTGGVSGLSLDPAESPLIFMSADQWLLLLAALWCGLIFVAADRLLKGPCGLAWMSLRDQPTAATAMGVDVPKWKAVAFAVSSAMVGAAGALSAAVSGFVSPDSFNVFLSLFLLVGVAISGPRYASGSFVAAAFLVFVPDLAERVSQEWTGVIYGTVMLASVYIAPGVRRLRMRRTMARRKI